MASHPRDHQPSVLFAPLFCNICLQGFECADMAMHSLWQDVRFGLRMLRKDPAFTFVAILTLALGIGASTAIFSVVDTVLLRPLPFPHPSQLVEISARVATYDIPDLPLSYRDFVDLRSSSSSFSAMAVYRASWKEFSSDDKPQRIENIEVSEDFFVVLGMQPMYGRTFVASDMLPGSRAVLLGFPLWKERFGSDPQVVGKSITLDGQPHTVVGVMSPQAPLPTLPNPKYGCRSYLAKKRLALVKFIAVP